MFERIRHDLPKVQHFLVFDGEAPDGMIDADAAMAAASAAEPEVPASTESGATMIYTSGTTGKPKGAFRRGSADPAQVAAMIALVGYTPDDVYMTTGPLYHSGPSGFMAIAQALGQTVVLQRRFDPEDWLRLVEDHRVTSDVQRADPDPHGVQPAGRGEGQVRRVVDEADDRQRRAVELHAEADVPCRLPGRLAVRGVRLDRARRQHHPSARGSVAQAGVVRHAGADGRDQAVRRRRQRGHRHRPGEHRRAVREEPECVRRLLQAARPVPEGSARRLSDRRRHRLPRRRGLLLHL